MRKGSCSTSRGSHMTFTLKRLREAEDPSVPDTSDSFKGLLFSCSSVGGVTDGDNDDDDERTLRKALRSQPWINYSNSGSSQEEAERETYDMDSDSSFDAGSVSEQTRLSPISSSLPLGVVRGCRNCEGCQKVLARWRPDAGCRPVLEDAPVFFPLDDEFKDTMKYIASIRAEAEEYGICRIVPPHSWRPPCRLRDTDKKYVRFPTRVQQVDKLQARKAQVKDEERHRRHSRVLSGDTTETLLLREDADAASSDEGKFGFEPGPPFTLVAFEKYAHQFKEEYFGVKECNDLFSDPVTRQKPSIESIEGEYWRIVEHPTEQLEVLYGADIETGIFGSGFPRAKEGIEQSPYERSGWNLNNVAKLPGSVLSFEESDISGVIVPWLYVGMCFSSFCWHVEDHHLYSLNYIHSGSPKIWYGVPANAAEKLEDVMKQKLPDLFCEQPDLLHKLVTQLSPSILKEAGVPVYRAVQRTGEFIVTFPRAYHAGFNCGFNCAEAVNVAPIDWLPRGQIAVELYKQQMRKTTVSHDKLLFRTVKKALEVSHCLQGLQDTADFSAWKDSLGQQCEVLFKVLKNRVNMERKRRMKIEGFVCVDKMDKNFDATDERECLWCHYDLHLSAIECECESERYACLEHIDALCSCEKTRKRALYRYGLTELDALVTALERNLDSWSGIEKFLNVVPKVGSLTSCSQEGGTAHNNVEGVDLNVSTKSTCDGSTASSVERSSTQNKCIVIDLDDTEEPEFPPNCSTESAATCKSIVMLQLDGQQRPSCIPMTPIWSLDFDAISAFLKNLENAKNQELCLTREMESREVFSVSAGPDCLVDNQQESEQHFVDRHLSEEKQAVEMIILSDDEDNPKSQSVYSRIDLPDSSQGIIEAARENVGLWPIEDRLPPSTEQSNADHNVLHSMATVNHLEKSVLSYDSVGRCSQYWMQEHVLENGAGKLQKAVFQVQLLNIGRLVIRNSWHNKDAIFPAGFRSRVLLHSILDPNQLWIYICEVLNLDNPEPIFKVVMEDCPSEVFMHPNIDRCWQMVQEKVNKVLQAQHGLVPGWATKIRGIDFFGFTTPYIMKAIEALDWQHQCLEYWAGKVSATQLLENQHHLYMPNTNVIELLRFYSS